MTKKNSDRDNPKNSDKRESQDHLTPEKRGHEIQQDLSIIEAVAKMVHEKNIQEVTYEKGAMRLKILGSSHPSQGETVMISAPPAGKVSKESAGGDQPINDPNLFPVESPMVGIAYLAPKPGESPFVALGDRVNKGDTLAIIEAMKVMNPLKASEGGIVEEINVADGSPVEFGEVLFRIKKASS